MSRTVNRRKFLALAAAAPVVAVIPAPVGNALVAAAEPVYLFPHRHHYYVNRTVYHWLNLEADRMREDAKWISRMPFVPVTSTIPIRVVDQLPEGEASLLAV